jgi:acetylornithine deacetylase/succinyl-diaminopimelate desuccinylase-like protein
MAHKPDEFVDEAQLAACLEFLERLAEDLSR